VDFTVSIECGCGVAAAGNPQPLHQHCHFIVSTGEG